MRDCPKCGAVVDGDWCRQCGEGKPKETAQTDADWWRCADTDVHGNRCSKPGSLAESTRGAERWYCHLHFAPFRGRGYGVPRVAPPTGWASAVRPATARPLASIAEELAERAAIQSEAA